MIKVRTGQGTGALIENDGTIIQVETIDTDIVKDDVRAARVIDELQGNKDMRHLCSLPWHVIHTVRRQNKWPNDKEHRDMAIKECVKLVYSGELRDLRVYGA